MILLNKHYAIMAELLLSIPMLLLIILTVGELQEGFLSGLQHVLQCIPLLLLAYFSWYHPKTGGKILIGLSSLLAALYLLFFPGFPFWTKLLNDFFLFGFSFIAGVLFITHERR